MHGLLPWFCVFRKGYSAAELLCSVVCKLTSPMFMSPGSCVLTGGESVCPCVGWPCGRAALSGASVY